MTVLLLYNLSGCINNLEEAGDGDGDDDLINLEALLDDDTIMSTASWVSHSFL